MVGVNMKTAEMNHDEEQRRKLQKYIFDLEEAKDKTEALSEAHRELKQSQDLLLSLLRGTVHGICLIRGRKFIWCNEAFGDILGWGQDELIGATTETIYPSLEEHERMGEVIYSDPHRIDLITYEYDYLHSKGHSVPCMVTGRSLDRDDPAKGYVFSFTDVTEQKKLEAQLLQAQKMEAIGTLAGGVAHDLNNILGGLVSYPELLLLQLPESSPLRKSILTIQKSGEKAAAVVQDLLTLARRGVVVNEVVNLNDVIGEYIESPEHEKLQAYHPGVHLETHLATDTLNILGSSTHLSKTVMNLVSNAAEAMPEGGKLTVSTENRYIDRPIGGYDNVREGDYVVITISDTGTGISPDDINKIFEPFYTKKKMGRSGTGLGMAVVWGTVKDHRGYIDVQSIEGEGTSFFLFFPVTRKKLPENQSHLPIESYSGKGESILIVDDVEEQRKIASGMLKELGYSALSVSSGEEAVEYLSTNNVDLLVLDMIMDPGMDGFDTYKKIIETRPGQKAIICSGFSETDRVKELQKLGAGEYVRKPLLLEKIGLAIKEELKG
jgi:two-component system, cell cycle sensor histidine kinase and response regulator CckA